MGNPGLDAETALQVICTLLYYITWFLGGSGLLGLSAYLVFLCWKILSPQPSSKRLLARAHQPIGCAHVTEENLDLTHAETPTPAEAESLNGEAVPVPALPHDAQEWMTPVRVTLGSEPTIAAVWAGSRPPEVPVECES